MWSLKSSMEPKNPLRSPLETLPTMYDLPSENPEEPGLPDEFHDYQPELLRLTFRPPNYSPERIFSGSDMNLYYDLRHPKRYKRPDWFGVVGVSRLYQEKELRLSYVIWQEKVSPIILVELLSPGTEDEDLGQTQRKFNAPPTKWEVYEQILKIPNYVVFDRYTYQLRCFRLIDNAYQELQLEEQKLWIPEIELGLGVWQGKYQEIDGLWLRWYNASGNWIPTPDEKEALAQQRAEAERQRAEIQRQQAELAESQLEALQQRLRELGIDLDS